MGNGIQLAQSYRRRGGLGPGHSLVSQGPIFHITYSPPESGWPLVGFGGRVSCGTSSVDSKPIRKWGLLYRFESGVCERTESRLRCLVLANRYSQFTRLFTHTIRASCWTWSYMHNPGRSGEGMGEGKAPFCQLLQPRMEKRIFWTS